MYTQQFKKLKSRLNKKLYKEYSGARCKHCRYLKEMRINLASMNFCTKQWKLFKHISVVAKYCKHYEDKNEK